MPTRRPNTMETFDPYRLCATTCTHDLARGVLVTELLARDGPYPAVQVVRTAGARRAWLLAPALRELPAAG